MPSRRSAATITPPPATSFVCTTTIGKPTSSRAPTGGFAGRWVESRSSSTMTTAATCCLRLHARILELAGRLAVPERDVSSTFSGCPFAHAGKRWPVQITAFRLCEPIRLAQAGFRDDRVHNQLLQRVLPLPLHHALLLHLTRPACPPRVAPKEGDSVRSPPPTAP